VYRSEIRRQGQTTWTTKTRTQPMTTQMPTIITSTHLHPTTQNTHLDVWMITKTPVEHWQQLVLDMGNPCYLILTCIRLYPYPCLAGTGICGFCLGYGYGQNRSHYISVVKLVIHNITAKKVNTSKRCLNKYCYHSYKLWNEPAIVKFGKELT
jgi:hypothetical protein